MMEYKETRSFHEQSEAKNLASPVLSYSEKSSCTKLYSEEEATK